MEYFLHLLQTEQKFVTMLFISLAVSQRILTKSDIDNLSGSENNLVKSEFKNSKWLPWEFGKML